MQAYGDAVFDEAPLLVLTNYRQSYFLRRNLSNVTDKTLYASPPIAHDNPAHVLPPLAAWLYVLKLVDDYSRQGVKQKLPRAEVPSTPVLGYPLTPGVTLRARSSGGSCVTGARRSARLAEQSRNRKRDRQQADTSQANTCQAGVQQAPLSQAAILADASGRRTADASTGHKRSRTSLPEQAKQQQHATEVQHHIDTYLEARTAGVLPQLTLKQLNLTTYSLGGSAECKVLKVRVLCSS